MNTLEELGIKNLERVCIKTKNEVAFGDRLLEAGEPVIYFDNLQIALLSENVRPIMARGGWHNEPRVIWEDRQETTFAFSNGTVNTISFNLLLGANMLDKVDDNILPYNEVIMLDEKGKGYLKYLPILNDMEYKNFFFTYDFNNIQGRISPISIDGLKIDFGKEFAYQTVMCDYYFEYKKDIITYSMNRERFTNLYTLEATFQMKDENEGLLRTGYLRMPKIRILSNINLRMGERADPMVSTFRVIAQPETKEGRDDVVCEIQYLDEDISGI